MTDTGLQDVSILLIDDSKPVRTVLKTLLKGMGANRIFECCDGEEALVVARAGRVDIALIDNDLGPHSGIDIVRQFRESPLSPNPDIPIVLLDPISATHVSDAAVAAVADRVLPKPVSARTLGEAISSLVRDAVQELDLQRAQA